MTSSTDVEIGDTILITDSEHAWFGRSATVITTPPLSKSIGVRVNGVGSLMSAVGVYVEEGQFAAYTKEEEAQGG